MAIALDLLKQTFAEWQTAKAPRMAAALAYYTAFSLAPLLIIAIGVAGLVYGHAAAQGQLFGPLQSLMGAQGAGAVQSLVQASSRPSSGVTATLVGFGSLLLGAAAIFGELQDSLNTIWHAPPQKVTGIWALVRNRLLSAGMVFAVGFLLLVSLVLSTALAAILHSLAALVPALVAVGAVLNIVVNWIVVSLLFAALFKYLPDVRLRWRDVLWGAGFTGVLFVAGQYLISLYLGLTSAHSSFLAAASLMVVLLWVYYSAQIFLFGAAFTRVYARQRGSKQAVRSPRAA